MRIILSQISLLFFVFLALSCTKNKYSGEIRSLDSLYQEIVIVEKQIKAVDSKEVKRTYEEIVRNVKFVRQDYTGSYDANAIELFSEYKRIRKPINNFDHNQEELLRELNYTKNQLKSLATDLKKGTMTDEKVKEYYQEEYSVAKKIHYESGLLLDSLTGALKKFQQLHPKVQEFINENIINQSASI